MEQKRREGKQKILKRGEGKMGQGMGALKMRGDWNPLTNYEKLVEKNFPRRIFST